MKLMLLLLVLVSLATAEEKSESFPDEMYLPPHLTPHGKFTAFEVHSVVPQIHPPDTSLEKHFTSLSLSTGPDTHHPKKLAASFGLPNKESLDLELRKVELFSENYRDMSWHPLHGMSDIARELDPADDCHYRGVDKSDPDSQVALSTCGGQFSGLVTKQGKSFVIEPHLTKVSRSAKLAKDIGNHFVYLLEDEMRTVNFECPVVRLGSKSQSGEKSFSSLGTAPPRFMEVLAISDDARWKKLGKHTKNTAVSLFNVISMLYEVSQTQLIPVLVGHIHFEGGTPYPVKRRRGTSSVEVEGNRGLLTQFSEWRFGKRSNLPRHDVALLLSGERFVDGILGLAGVSSMCSRHSATITSVVTSTATSAVVAAHELGHCLGMGHDGLGNSCPKRGYVMAPYAAPSQTFSSCSKAEYGAYLRRSGSCLTYRDPRRGRATAEPAEEEELQYPLCIDPPCDIDVQDFETTSDPVAPKKDDDLHKWFIPAVAVCLAMGLSVLLVNSFKTLAFERKRDQDIKNQFSMVIAEMVNVSRIDTDIIQPLPLSPPRRAAVPHPRRPLASTEIEKTDE